MQRYPEVQEVLSSKVGHIIFDDNWKIRYFLNYRKFKNWSPKFVY